MIRFCRALGDIGNIQAAAAAASKQAADKGKVCATPYTVLDSEQ